MVLDTAYYRVLDCGSPYYMLLGGGDPYLIVLDCVWAAIL